MLYPFLIMFREGVEAALIVGIIASYLKQTGRTHLMKSVWIGVVLATIFCLIIAIVLQITSSEFPQQEQELFAAIISLVAVGVLTWMVFWMRRAARAIKGELQSQVEAAIESGDKWGLALVWMAFFAVLREGLETVVFLLATFQQNLGIKAPVGALFGYVAAIAIVVSAYHPILNQTRLAIGAAFTCPLLLTFEGLPSIAELTSRLDEQNFLSDSLATAEYRRQVTQVLMARSLAEVVKF